MLTTRTLKLALAAVLAGATLNLPGAALAQTACPDPGGMNPNGNCVNTIDPNYTESPSTTVSGTYTNQISGQVTATGNGGIALTVDEFENGGTVTAVGTGTGTGIYVNNGFTNSGTLSAEGIDGGKGIHVVSGGFINSGTLSAEAIDDSTGIHVVRGGFINSGTVDASVSGSGTNSVYGYGLFVSNGGFTNNGGTVYAANYGSANSSGLYVSNDGFINNSGTVYATSTGNSDSESIGLYVGVVGFINNDTVYATATNYGYGIWINNGGSTNSGTVTASGSDNGYGIVIGHGFANSGVINASGSDNGYGILTRSGSSTSSGIVNAFGSDNGYGIYAESGNFTNSGIVNAFGSDNGYGIYDESGSFTNRGIVNASGSDNGYGIYAESGILTNSGTVYATGYSDSCGIYIGNGFDNSGIVYASGSDKGYGINIGSGDFANNGQLTLNSNGGTALYFGGSSSQTFNSESGSSLIIAGSDPAIVFDTVGSLSINGKAGLSILSVNGIVDGSQSFVVAQNVYDTGSFTFDTADSAVFSYSQGWADNGGGSGDYTVSVTREGWASEMTGGEGGKFVEGLENYFISKGANVEGGSSTENWLYLMNDINSGATRAEVKRRGQDGARLNTAQATGQSLRLVQDASRRAGAIFNKELSKQMRQGTAPAAGGNESSASVWFSPFYLTATQDSSDRSISSVDGDWWGFSLGAGYAPQDNLNFGLGFHFLKGDIDAGRAYDADSTAWGLDLGFAANLGSGRYRPLLTGTVSHTRHDYDQTRRADGYAYKSSPDIKVTTAALNLSQDFHPAGDNLIIRPKIGFDWTRTDMDGYTERGPGLRALKVDSEKYDSYRSELGSALVWKPVEAFELALRAAWLHDFGDRTPILTSVARDVQGLNLYTPRSDDKRDSAAVGASASFEAGSGFSLGLDYDGQFNSDLDSHQIWGSLKYTF